MARKFITERDIAAYAAEGLEELVLEPDMVLTDMAVERARSAKIRLVRAESAPKDEGAPRPKLEHGPSTLPWLVDAESGAEEEGDPAARVRAAVIAKLGHEPDGLDAIIKGIMAKLS